MTTPIEERALNQVVDSYICIQADQEWLVRQTPTSVSYWLSALETKIRSDKNDDGSVKLRSETIIVSDVSDPIRAEQVCAALNTMSPSWAYVYDYEDRKNIFELVEQTDVPVFRTCAAGTGKSPLFRGVG